MTTINVSEGKLNSSPFYILYETINRLNGMSYVGQHTTYDLNDGYIGSGKYLWRAIDKHGRENFERRIIKFCSSLEELLEEERKYVTLEFCKRKDTYNLIPGGNAGMVVGSPAHKKLVETKNSPEGKERIIKAAIEVANRPESKQRQSVLIREQWKDPEFRKATISSAKKNSGRLTKSGIEYIRSEKGRKENSERSKKQWETTDIRERLTKSRQTKEYRKKKSTQMLEYFSDRENRDSLSLSKTKFKYHTPFGVFSTAKDVLKYMESNDNYISISLSGLRKLCRGTAKVNKTLIEKIPELSKGDIGKSPEEVGFYMESIA